MLNIVIGVGCLVCAFLAVREKRLLISALWLALTSALVSWLMYNLGAAEVAVVELSVGAGLVTVLFVFAINIAGDETDIRPALVPRPLAWVLVVLGIVMLGWMILPALQVERFLATLQYPSGSIEDFRRILWGERGLDTLLQVVLIFAGVMSVLSLLGSRKEEPEEGEQP